jgi:hypothetical protein
MTHILATPHFHFPRSGRSIVLAWIAACILGGFVHAQDPAHEDVLQTVDHGLTWLASQQTRQGSWTVDEGRYPTAMTALSGMAFLAEGSTTSHGKYSEQVRSAVDFLQAQYQSNGLIGDPLQDDRYTYGHGYSMLFLSQVLGEEEDMTRRNRLVTILTNAVQFTGNAQTAAGGWGYVSAKEGRDSDEGSTTITQVQGLRACRNAGIPTPRVVIDRAVAYIKQCSVNGGEGGVQYSTNGGDGRPAISAAAIACLFNAGDYDNDYVPKLLDYCNRNLEDLESQRMGDHWHYAHYYYAQVKYREGGESWDSYRDRIYDRLINEAGSDGCWNQGSVGPVFTTAVNLSILQLENGFLPIYQR